MRRGLLGRVAYFLSKFSQKCPSVSCWASLIKHAAWNQYVTKHWVWIHECHSPDREEHFCKNKNIPLMPKYCTSYCGEYCIFHGQCKGTCNMCSWGFTCTNSLSWRRRCASVLNQKLDSEGACRELGKYLCKWYSRIEVTFGLEMEVTTKPI